MLRAKRFVLVRSSDGYSLEIELGESGSLEVTAEEGIVIDVERLLREHPPDATVSLGRGERVRVDGFVFERSRDDKLVIYLVEE